MYTSFSAFQPYDLSRVINWTWARGNSIHSASIQHPARHSRVNFLFQCHTRVFSQSQNRHTGKMVRRKICIFFWIDNQNHSPRAFIGAESARRSPLSTEMKSIPPATVFFPVFCQQASVSLISIMFWFSYRDALQLNNGPKDLKIMYNKTNFPHWHTMTNVVNRKTINISSHQ